MPRKPIKKEIHKQNQELLTALKLIAESIPNVGSTTPSEIYRKLQGSGKLNRYPSPRSIRRWLVLSMWLRRIMPPLILEEAGSSGILVVARTKRLTAPLPEMPSDIEE